MLWRCIAGGQGRKGRGPHKAPQVETREHHEGDGLTRAQQGRDGKCGGAGIRQAAGLGGDAQCQAPRAGPGGMGAEALQRGHRLGRKAEGGEVLARGGRHVAAGLGDHGRVIRQGQRHLLATGLEHKARGAGLGPLGRMALMAALTARPGHLLIEFGLSAQAVILVGLGATLMALGPVLRSAATALEENRGFV